MVVLAVKRERTRREQSLQDRDRLREPGDAHARTVEGHPGLLVVDRHPARADAELEAAVGEQIERGHLAREHHRVLVVVAEHERADAQRVGDGRDVRERDRGREIVVDEVIGHEERRVAERLGLARLLGELPPRAALGRDDTESKRTIHGSGPYPLASRSSPSRRGRVRSRRGRQLRPTRRSRSVGSRAARCDRRD